LGRLIAYTDPQGQITQYKLDVSGRPIQRINSLGHSLNYEYDAAGRLQTLINENKEKYNFEYDPLDRLVKEQGLDGLLTRYDYDTLGNVTQKTEALNTPEQRVTDYERDIAGALKTKTIHHGDKASHTYYEYDQLGQLSRAENSHAVVGFQYDSMGQIVSESTTATAFKTQTLLHEYDLLGNRTKTVLPSGKALNWHYEGVGHLKKIDYDGELLSEYERDALHREVKQSQGILESVSQYDAIGRLISKSVEKTSTDTKVPNPKATLLKRSYTYNRVGDLTGVEDSRVGNTEYSYDAIGRITKTQTKDTTERFAFDPAHNLLDKGNEENIVKGNRLNTYQDKRYEYDTFGNMTRKLVSNHTTMKFDYDAEHQMQRSIITKHGVTQTFHYTYDPFGRRIGKWDEFGVTHFLWDGNRLLSETRNTKTTTYVYEQFGFTPVAQIDSSNNIHYYHNDHLGTPRELTDQEGNITWEAQYTTWGNTVKVEYKQTESKIHEDVQQQPLRFQGQYYDHETGLHYNRFRYYDPDIGRFISQDPIGLMGGVNNYQYAPNPMGWIDPLGLNVTTGAGRTHITYEGIRNGKPYTGYASMPGTGHSGQEVLDYRYKSEFDPANPKVPDTQPDIVYKGEGVEGKQTARGLEQHGYDKNVEKYGKDGVDNKQRPVGENNANKEKYEKAAKKHLNKQDKCKC